MFASSSPPSIDESLPALPEARAPYSLQGPAATGGGQPESCIDERVGGNNRNQQLTLTEKLLDQHYDSVYRYAYHLSGCSNSAEDITQEVFVRAFCNVHQLQSMEAGLSWLLTITRHEAFRHLKRKDLSLPNVALEFSSNQCHVQDIIRQEWVHRALQQLPVEFRVVVLMFYFEQKSYTEIAQELAVPLGTVMSRLNRARKHLKEALDTVGEPPSKNEWNVSWKRESSE